MLSTEYPPPDPLCPPCEESLVVVKSGCGNSDNSSGSSRIVVSDDDEKKAACDEIQVVDLLDSGLDDNNNNNPLPKFCIRDYVFSTRNKDIATNWPFSSKNLQLCLEHGVKDVLPPFQCLESVRNPSIVKCSLKDLSNESDVRLSEPQFVSTDITVQKLGENINSSGSEEDKEVPSTTTSQSRSNKISLLPSKSPYLEADDKAEFAVPASNMVKSSIQNPVKKGRLILKVSGITEPKLNEVSTLNTSAVSETMASKVCPVCKTFSSSSNTTLNAHIDQCLSGETSTKCTENVNVIKHRIKPRKTKLMVDIYATALHCTLEDLDRRNGTNWASNSSVPAQDLNMCAEEKNAPRSSENIADSSKEGAVYIDSSGTKLRILSKLGDPPSNSIGKDDCGARKLVKKDKGTKSLSSKKKCNFQKDKLQKSSLGERTFRRLDHCHEVNDDQRRELPREEAYQREDGRQPPKAADRMRSDDLGMIKQWVGSKRTRLKKRMNLGHENHHMDKNTKNSTARSSLSSVGDVARKRTSDSSSPVSFDENVPLDKRIEDFSFDSDDEDEEQPRLRKRAESSLLDSQGVHGYKNRMMFSNCNGKQLRKDGNNKKKSDVSFLRPRLSSGGTEIISSKKISLNHGILSGGKKFSSSRNESLESEKFQERKHLQFKKPRFETSGSDEEAVASQVTDYRKYAPVEKPGQNSAWMAKSSSESVIRRDKYLEVRKKRSQFTNSGKEGGDMGSECSDTSESDSDGPGKNMEEVETLDEFVRDPTSSIADTEAFMTFSKSLGSDFSGPSDDACVSQQYAGVYKEHRPVGLVLGHEEELYCGDIARKETSCTPMVAEMDVNEERGNYFVDVDPIPIPGPPGSFLPSPGRMDSEELLGNSSLTTCRIQSSEDEHELVNMGSSDSPVSSMSMVSQSVAARSNSVSFANMSMPSYSIRHSAQCEIREDRINPIVGSSILSEQTSRATEGKLNVDVSRSNLIVPEMSTLRFKNSQPCCCSMKEAAPLSGSLNYQESQLLRRRTMTSLALPEKHVGGNHKNEVYAFNSRSQARLEEQAPEREKNMGNSHMSYSPALVSQRSEGKFPTFGNLEPPGPSTPNSVFRLMGKNLMVMNKDENVSPQIRPSHSSTISGNPGLISSVDNGLSFRDTSNRTPSMFANTQNSMPLQHCDFRPSNGFKVPAYSGKSHLSVHPSTNVPPCHGFGQRFTPSLVCREYTGMCNLPRLDIRSDIGKVQTPIAQGHPENLPGSQPKEIIVIDDSPDGEAAHGGSTAEGYNSRNANSFYGFQAQGYPLGTGSRTFQNANIQASHSKGMNADTVKWDCIPEGSSALRPNSLTASLPSTGQLRSSMYFSPSFS